MPLPPSNSQHALAISIARAIQTELPATDSEEAIRASVEDTLREEARHNELLLAYLRCGLVAIVVLGALAAYLRPEWLPGGIPWLAAATALAVWTAASILLTLALRRGWYRLWVRRAAPLTDGVAIVGIFLAIDAGFDGVVGAAAAGPAIAAAAAAALLTLSGALRLTRTAVRLSTAVGAAAWISVAVLADLSLAIAAPTALLIIACGVIAGRITRIIRRVITEEAARIRLVHLYRQAEEAVRVRKEVVGMVSHDLRNPLGVILQASSFVVDDRPPAPVQLDMMGRVRRQADVMLRLTNDLLDVSKAESGGLLVDPQPAAPALILENALDLMEPLAADRRLTLSVDADPALPDVHADVHRIGQVLSNLLGNAVKFTPVGGAITLTARSEGGSVRFGVRDTGPGIPPDQLSMVFSHMWQAREGDSRGIGLGLTIARTLIEAHGDRIRVESTPGEGTEFWFTLPVATSARHPEENQAPSRSTLSTPSD